MSSRISDVQDHLSEVSDQTNKKFNIIKENVNLKLTNQLDFKNTKTNRWRKCSSRKSFG